MPAVSNSSPLVLFAKLGRLDILQGVYGEVYIPLAVLREVESQGSDRPGAAEVPGASWIRVHLAVHLGTLQKVLPRLDAGEAEAIALGVGLGSEVPILLDDLKARRIASELGLRVVGCAGVLVVAKDSGIIDSVRPILDDLRQAGLYLSDATYRRALTQAGEHIA